MLIHMRTTLVIDDAVFSAAKRRALEAGMTLSDLTTQALRSALREASGPQPASRFLMPVHGGGTIRETTPAELAALRDDGR